MSLRPKFSLGIASSDDGWSAPHAAQGGGGLEAQFPSLGYQQIGDFMDFEMTPHVFNRVEFRGVSREPFQDDAPLGGDDELFDQQTAMDRRPIPEDQNLAGDVPLQMPEKRHDLGAFDASFVHLEVKPPQGQTANNGKAFPVEGLMQDGRLSARRPGANPRWAGAQPAFIDEDDGSPLLVGLFFKAGQVTRCQWRMAFSSRSTARRSGRWQLKPLAPSNRHT